MENINEIFSSGSPAASHEDQWISLSDLMTGLMLIFMLIAVAFMLKTQADSLQLNKFAAQMKQDAIKMQKQAQDVEEQAKKRQEEAEQRQEQAQQRQEQAQKQQEDAVKMQEAANKIQQIAVVYNQVKNELYEELKREFASDFPKWGATLDKDLTIRFENENVMFDRGQDQVKPGFKAILQDFFPRYLKIITSEKYRASVKEVRIEGHTSSIWSAGVSKQEAYFKNMELSQSRTRSTLRYMMDLPQVSGATPWLERYVTANGLSSSQPILNADGSENEALSQRVEFRIRTDAESKINDILQSVK